MLLPLLALSAPTAMLVVPGHLLLSLLTMAGALLDGWSGNASRPPRWLFGYLLASLLATAALELAADLRGATMGYWALPWTAMLLWGWCPPLVAGFAGWLGTQRARRLSRRAVKRRHAQVDTPS